MTWTHQWKEKIVYFSSSATNKKNIYNYYNNDDLPTPTLCECSNRNTCNGKDNRYMDTDVVYNATVATNAKYTNTSGAHLLIYVNV